MQFSKRSAIVAMAAAAVFSTSTLAEETYRLTTGAVGGTYYGVIGVNLRNILREKGINFDVMESKGSVENLERLSSSEADVGLTQGDAAAAFFQTNPAADVEILGSLGQECVFLVTHKDSGIEEIQDLDQPDQKVAVGAQGSGSAQTWDYMRTLNSDYAEPQVFYQGGVRALGQVQTGQLDAFLWVTSPENRDHNLLNAVLVDNSPFRFVEIDDDKLSSTLPNGTQVYTSHEVVGRTNTGWFGGDEDVDTVCTDLMVVADYNLDTRVQEEVATAVLMNANRINGK